MLVRTPACRQNFQFIYLRGSAFPATLAFQIRELERETNDDFKLDAIVTVIDAENFTGYEDTSPTARMQASYSDLILIVGTTLVWCPLLIPRHAPTILEQVGALG